MNIFIAGAFGALGKDLVRKAVSKGYDVTAAGVHIREIEGVSSSEYQSKQIDVSRKESLEGVLKGIDIVITTIGLTKASKETTNYEVDYLGNKNLLEEAIRFKVKKFVFVSVIHAENHDNVPIVHSKYLFEEELKNSGITYVIHRPSGFFYDIAHVFMPMIEKGKVSLLGKKDVYANVIDTSDFADYIIEHLGDENVTYEIGGKETYSYREMAELFANAKGTTIKISYAPAWLFDVLALVSRWKKEGKECVIRFSKWTLCNDMVGDVKYGKLSFQNYIKELYK